MTFAFSEELLIEKIKQKTGKTETEINAWAEEKTKKFSGLLSKEAALFLLAKEAGIEIENERVVQPVPINQLQSGAMNVDVIAVVKRVFPPKEFQNKNKPGTGKKASLLLADATGEIFAAFWHQDSEKLNKVPTGATVLLRNVSVSYFNNQNSLNFGYRSELVLNPSQEHAIALPKIELQKKQLQEITTPVFNLNIETTIQEIYPVKEFTKQTGESGKLQRIALASGEYRMFAVAWNEKTIETQKLKMGQKILLENVRAKENLRGELEIMIDNTSRIIGLDSK